MRQRGSLPAVLSIRREATSAGVELVHLRAPVGQAAVGVVRHPARPAVPHDVAGELRRPQLAGPTGVVSPHADQRLGIGEVGIGAVRPPAGRVGASVSVPQFVEQRLDSDRTGESQTHAGLIAAVGLARSERHAGGAADAAVAGVRVRRGDQPEVIDVGRRPILRARLADDVEHRGPPRLRSQRHGHWHGLPDAELDRRDREHRQHCVLKRLQLRG